MQVTWTISAETALAAASAARNLSAFRADAAVSDEDAQIETDISYADFAAWAGRFMSEDAATLLPWVFAEGADGKLLVRRAETDSGIDWGNLSIRSVTAGEGGGYTAELGAASADFTVTESGGLYRIETITLTENP